MSEPKIYSSLCLIFGAWHTGPGRRAEALVSYLHRLCLMARGGLALSAGGGTRGRPFWDRPRRLDQLAVLPTRLRHPAHFVPQTLSCRAPYMSKAMFHLHE